MLDIRIVTRILLYDVVNFRKFLRLSPNWRFLVLEGLDDLFKGIEVAFANKYYEHLLFKRSYTNSSVIFSGGRAGLRVDRVLVCEVLKNQEHLNKCLRISYAYKLEA
jgi:hypothetical protein